VAPGELTAARRVVRPASGLTALRLPPLRLLLVVDSLDPGGAERHVVDLALTLARGGHDVTVACSLPGPLAIELLDGGVPVEPLMDGLVKRRFSPTYAAALGGLLRAQRFDLVHAHVYASEVAVAEAARGTRVPLVLSEHTEAPWRGGRERALSRLTFRRADHLIAVSTAIRRQLVEQFGVPAEKVSYVANAVRPFADEAPAPALPEGGPLIGRVARLQPEKGIDVFLRAAAAVAARVPAARFLVVGDGPLRDELPALAAELGIADRVRFLGHRPDARAIIARLDVLAVSSITDGSPLVNLEAMAAGTPIVASACGGIPDQIRDGRDGLLVAPGDAAALARGLLRLVEEPELARRLGAAARRRAEMRFSYEAMLARVEACYGAALTRRGAASARLAEGIPAS
jgi:glycosyltransferase involved in cell wall biosynthesis